MSFDEFVASKRWTNNILASLGFDDGDPDRGGFIYADCCYIEDNTTRLSDLALRGRYFLVVEQFDWVSDDLEEMQKILWACYYVHEAGIDRLAGRDLDAFMQGICAARNMRFDADIFRLALAGQEIFTPGEAEAIAFASAKAFGLYKSH